MRYFIAACILTAVLAGCKTPTGGTVALFAEAANDSLNLRMTDRSPIQHSARQIAPEKKPDQTNDRVQTEQENPMVVDTTSTEKTTKSEVKHPPVESVDAVETEEEIDQPSEIEDSEKGEEADENQTINTDKAEIDPDAVELNEITDFSERLDQGQEKVTEQTTNDATRDSLMNVLQTAEDKAQREKQKLTEQLEQQQKAKEKAELERNQLADDFKQLQDEINALAEALTARVEDDKQSPSEKRSEANAESTTPKPDRRDASDRSDRQYDYRQEQGLSNEELLLRLTALQVIGRQTGGQTVIVSTNGEKNTAIEPTEATQADEALQREVQLLNDSLSSMNLALRRYKALAELKLDSIGRTDNGIQQRYLDDLRNQTDSLNQVLERMQQMNAQRTSVPEKSVQPDTVYTEVIKEVIREAPTEKTETIELTALFSRGAMVANNQLEIVAVIQAAVKEKNVVRIKLSSHTDRSGNAETNLEYSRRRAEIFRKALTDAGIDETLIYSQHFGSRFASEAVIDEERRIEVTIVLSDGKN